MSCIEHLQQDDFLATVQMLRVSVPEQPGDVSCGWRTAFNAHLLLKRIFNIADVSDVITCISIIGLHNYLFFKFASLFCVQECQMDAYEPRHVKEFRIRATQRLILAVHEYAADAPRRAEEQARQALQQQIELEEAGRRQAMEYQESVRNFEICQAEVEEFVATQQQTALDRAWLAAEEAEAELHRATPQRSRPPPNRSRGRGGRGGQNP